MIQWGLGKLVAATVLLFLPAWLYGWTATLAVFLGWSLVAGLVLAALFVCTHTVIGTRYPVVDEHGRFNRGRMYLGIVGSADVAIDSPLVNWLFSGVTAHTAHHLYPGISATHYPAIARLVRQYCAEHGIPYTGFSGFREALVAHHGYLRALGHPGAVGERNICPA